MAATLMVPDGPPVALAGAEVGNRVTGRVRVHCKNPCSS